jgi:hypothetical protein
MSESHEASISHVISAGGGWAGGTGLGRPDRAGPAGAGVADVVEVAGAAGRLRARRGTTVAKDKPHVA